MEGISGTEVALPVVGGVGAVDASVMFSEAVTRRRKGEKESIQVRQNG